MKIQKVNLKRGLKIVRAPLQGGEEKEKGLVLRVRGYIRMEMIRNEWTRKSSISGGGCNEK